MPAWTPAALGGAGFIAIHYVLLRAASGRIEDRLGALVLESSAAIGSAASLLVGTRGDGTSTRAGVAFAAARGKLSTTRQPAKARKPAKRVTPSKPIRWPCESQSLALLR